jgi:hypothetical protein
MSLKGLVRRMLPPPVLRRVQDFRTRRAYAGLPPQEVFAKIYREGAWGGRGAGQGPYSGTGSRGEAVSAYVEAVGRWAAGFDRPLDAVDLGCGDFSVGSRLRGHFGAYRARDIVPEVIAADRERFADMNVDFGVLDIARDPLPPGEVALVRQVLQHLSNDMILAALPKLVAAYEHLIVTEHLPAADRFPPNLDKPTGPGIRVTRGSGVVLTELPFGLRPVEALVLCDVPWPDGRLLTTAYRLR